MFFFFPFFFKNKKEKKNLGERDERKDVLGDGSKEVSSDRIFPPHTPLLHIRIGDYNILTLSFSSPLPSSTCVLCSIPYYH